MSRNANPGELRTQIAIESYIADENENGYDDNSEWVNVFGEGVYIGCKWVNAYGNEVTTAKQLGLIEPATLTMRYSPLITPSCRICKYGDETPYEIIGINNVLEQNKWLEIKVQREVKAV